MKFAGTRLVTRLGLALVAVAVPAVTGCSMIKDASKSDTAKAAVGDCINVLEGASAKTEPVDCSSEKAVYKVMQVFDSTTTCKEGYTSYEETLNGGTTAFLCLAPNLKEGVCYNENPSTGYRFVDCTAPEASFKVTKRIDGKADEFECASADAVNFIVVPDPATTFCLGTAKA
ncbi:hypothetical protein JK358_24875 [Nocardia sp. 2]|uniref:Pyridine nucleotide-disulfide oxidoreductase n=1 Tax=Nocardia acididurans TaxID=2802282 RepID=A0ABS1MAK8_9NOCA|nr:hypothetical protein [Nocardia acididurans]MBL1077642.1 hypothetical protein [Nocardia acididurans]